MNQDHSVTQKQKLISNNRHRRSDIKEWIYVDSFGSYDIYKKGDLRRLVKPGTGKTICEYTIGISGSIHTQTVNG